MAASATHVPPGWIAAFTDSECAVAALEKSGSTLLPYFSNRVAEASSLLQELKSLTHRLHPVYHIPGVTNPADLGTRGQTGIDKLDRGSIWQTGPSFLLGPEEEWPTAIARKSSVSLKECSAKHVFTIGSEKTVTPKRQPEVPVGWRMLKLQARCKSKLGQSIRALVRHCLQKGGLNRPTRITARVLKSIISGNPPSLGDPEPTPAEWESTRQIQFVVSAPSALQAWKEGKTRSLGGHLVQGEVWIESRVHEAKLADLLGVPRLRVLCPEEDLAVGIMTDAHEEDHRKSYRDVVARSRGLAWILRATQLAKKLIGRCPGCRIRNKKEAEQIMGKLPEEKLTPSAPFVSAALDMFGPFKVKDAAGGRRSFKCWGAAYSCLVTKACSLLVCPGYDTASFLTTHLQFTSTYGHPAVLYTDHAPSLVKAADTPDWSLVADDLARKGTTWRFSPKGCSWRNGQAERLIRLARHSLSLILEKNTLLDLHQFAAVLAKAAAVINSRPCLSKLVQMETTIQSVPQTSS